jgi:hypothetical protein
MVLSARRRIIMLEAPESTALPSAVTAAVSGSYCAAVLCCSSRVPQLGSPRRESSSLSRPLRSMGSGIVHSIRPIASYSYMLALKVTYSYCYGATLGQPGGYFRLDNFQRDQHLRACGATCTRRQNPEAHCSPFLPHH